MKRHDEKPNTLDWDAIREFFADCHDVFYLVGVRSVRCVKSVARFTHMLWRPLWGGICALITRVRDFFTAKRYERLRSRVWHTLAPVAAAVVLLFTVTYWQQAEYVLALEYDGTAVGCVANESVYTDAAVLAREAVINADGSFKVDAAPTMTLLVADNDTTMDKNQLRDRILSVSKYKLTHAFGLYIGGEFCGAMAARGSVETVMERVLRPHESEKYDGVDFLNSWEIVEGLYPASTLCDAAVLQTRLEQKPIKTYVNITYTETVKYGVVRVVDTSQPLGYESVTTKGKNGTRKVEAQIIYVNGEERYRTVTATTDIKPAVNQVLTVGAQTYTDDSIIGDGVATGTFVWPLPYTKNITSYFASRWGSFHGAIDIAGGYTHGKPIIASDGGVVVEAGFHNSCGNYVLIDHGNGFKTRYAHCSVLEVKEGDKVAQGQYIAKVGDTGFVTGSHLHFEVIKDGRLVNPLNYVKR